MHQEKSQLDILLEKATKQINANMGAVKKSRSKAYGGVKNTLCKELGRLYGDLQNLASTEPYCLTCCRGYGNAKTFSYKAGVLNAEVNPIDFGGKFEDCCLKITTASPSMEFSPDSRFRKYTEIPFGSRIKQIEPRDISFELDDAIELVKGQRPEDQLSIGVAMKNGKAFRVPITVEHLRSLGGAFLAGEDISPTLKYMVKERFQ